MDGITLSGINWGELFASIPAAATARALALALTPITGSMPAVTNYGGYSEIQFSADQETRLTEWILSQLRREPGPVRVDAAGVALKVITRQYWPYIVGLVGAGIAIGYVARKGR